MDHLEYKDTNNKVFKTYYDKFKKMVKQDLNGDGWFLLVKDFPFKDGDNLMFTAGEDIGKWTDKNLVSLYGKTKYIVGRCRKKGPVISLLDFQEGDYVKAATEAGLRKELKEFFKGTGVSVRTFKSLKVTEVEPDATQEDTTDESTAQEGNDTASPSTEPLIPPLNSLGEKRNFIMKMSKEIPTRAKAVGIDDTSEFKTLWNNLIRLVRGGKVNPALETTEELLKLVAASAPAPNPPDEPAQSAEPESVDEEVETASSDDPNLQDFIQELDTAPDTSKLEQELARWQARKEELEDSEIPDATGMQQQAQAEMERLIKEIEGYDKSLEDVRKRLNINLDKITQLEKSDPEGSLEEQQQLAETNIDIIENEVEAILAQKEDAELSIKENLLVEDFGDQQITVLQRELAQVNRQIDRLENTLAAASA